MEFDSESRDYRGIHVFHSTDNKDAKVDLFGAASRCIFTTVVKSLQKLSSANIVGVLNRSSVLNCYVSVSWDVCFCPSPKRLAR